MSRTTITISRSGATAADDPHCFNRIHPKLPEVARAAPGNTIVFETRDALDGQFSFDSGPQDVLAADLNRVHPMTGPITIEGAEPGDALAVTVVDIEPGEYGFTAIAPGFGFLRDLFDEPFIANWHLDRLAAWCHEIPGVRIPMSAFPGSIGVLPDAAGHRAALAREQALLEAGGMVMPPEPAGAVPASLFGPGAPYAAEGLRTTPPREFGGNMDIKGMQIGTTIVFPVFVEGAGLWCGDVHFAQGDGEVCGSAIEMAARVTLRCELRKGAGRQISSPHFEGSGRMQHSEPTRFHATTGLPLKKAGELPPHLAWLDSPKLAALENVAEDLTLATRDALIRMIEWMQRERGLSREQALVVASAAVDLRIGQLVDVPNMMVSAVLPLDIFEG